MQAHTRFPYDLAIYSLILFPSPCFSTTFFSWGGKKRQSFSQTLSYLLISLSIIIHLFYMCYFYCPCLCHCLYFVVCFYVPCSFLLEVSGGGKVHTMNCLHPPFQHDPFSRTNVNCILCHQCSPLYILLSLVGIPSNDLMIIVVNPISKILHGGK